MWLPGHLTSCFPSPHPMKISAGHHLISEVWLGDPTNATVTEKWTIIQKASVQAWHLCELHALLTSSYSPRAGGTVRITGPYLHKLKQCKDMEQQNTNVLSCKKLLVHAHNMREGGKKKNTEHRLQGEQQDIRSTAARRGEGKAVFQAGTMLLWHCFSSRK